MREPIKTLKNTRLGKLPFFDFPANQAWATIAALALNLVSWLQLTPLPNGHKPRAVSTQRAVKRILGEEELADYISPWKEPARHRSWMAMAAYTDARYTVSLVPLLQEVQIPTRLVWCREDDFQKISFARRDVREIGGSDLVEVDGKHIPTEDSPAAVARAVLDHLGTRPTLIRGHVHTRPGGRPSTGPGNFAGVGAC